MLDTVISLGLVGTNAASTYFVQAPYRCTILDVRATAQNSDIGDADTVVVTSGIGGTDVGTATFGSDIAAGAKATYAPDTTNGKLVVAAGAIIQVVVSQLDAAGDRVHVEIELDPFARTT